MTDCAGFTKRVASLLLAAAISLGSALPAAAEKSKLSLDDLGFTPSQTQSDPKLQALLERRTRMLKTHQILGLCTAVPMGLALFSSHGGTEASASHRNVHAALGGIAAGMYFTTAAFAMLAPDPPDEKPRSGPTKVHVALAFVHFPAMVLTPILGDMALHQRAKGEAVHGIARLHKVAAGTAFLSYFLALTVMTVNF